MQNYGRIPKGCARVLMIGWVAFVASLEQRVEAQTGPRYPFPQHVTYAPGTIRPNHRTQAQQDDDVRAAYVRWKTYYLARAGSEPDGSPRYRVRFSTVTKDDKTVSEGQGYGMMIVALMAGADPDARTIFDGLWHFFNDHRSTGDRRLMDWTVPTDEHDDGDNTSAFDGDADIAFGLLLADRQWGSDGKIVYRHEAEDVMAGILASEIGPQSRLPMFGDWVQPNGATYNQYTTRPSDFMPDHFRAFARVTSGSAWTQVATACQGAATSLQNAYSPATGLLPDFAVPISATNHTLKPASPNFLEAPTDGDYYFNAGRVPWRFATDALLTSDSVSATVARRITRWARTATGGNPKNIRPGYRLDGTPVPPGDWFTIFFVSPIGVAAMTAPEQQQWLNAIYDAVRTAHENYYEDTVTLLCLLVMTGNWWDPANPPLPRPTAAKIQPW